MSGIATVAAAVGLVALPLIALVTVAVGEVLTPMAVVHPVTRRVIRCKDAACRCTVGHHYPDTGAYQWAGLVRQGRGLEVQCPGCGAWAAYRMLPQQSPPAGEARRAERGDGPIFTKRGA